MKKLIYIVIMMLITVSLYAKTEELEFTKDYNHLFNVSQETKFNLVNKYGDINIKNWTKNQVQVDVKITVNVKNQEKADLIFETIKINFSEEENLISAITEIEESSKFFTVYQGDGGSYQIDYDIYLPVYLQVELSNKYGNTYVSELQSRSNFTIKYGDLKAENLVFPDTKPYSKINIKYGNVDIKKVSWCTIISKYSDINIENSTALIMLSKYSDYIIGNNIAIVTESKYDEFKINNTNHFVLTGSYTDVNIKELGSQLVIDTKYSSMNIEKISSRLKKVRLIVEYTDVKLAIDKDSEFTINGTAKYGDLSFDKISTIDTKDSDNSSLITTGYYNSETTNNKFTFNVKYGDISLIVK